MPSMTTEKLADFIVNHPLLGQGCLFLADEEAHVGNMSICGMSRENHIQRKAFVAAAMLIGERVTERLREVAEEWKATGRPWTSDAEAFGFVRNTTGAITMNTGHAGTFECLVKGWPL